jgi:murein DD-endopeptidase MepM/ murein hydrolase activator NlpD
LDPGSVTLRRKTAVSRGERLGTMGAWGADRAPWFHFELRFENKGAEAASVLEALQLSGRRLSDYLEGRLRR